MYDFVFKHKFKFLFGIFTVCLLSTIIIVVLLNNIPLNLEEKERLYEAEEIITNDITKVVDQKNATVELKENKIHVVLKGKKSKLEITYDRQNKVLSKKFVDNRWYKNPVECIGFIILGTTIFPIVILGLIILSAIFIDENREKRKAKRQ